MKCLECGEEFEATQAKRLFCAGKCKKRFNKWQKYKCFYCGDPATDRDHILPTSTTGKRLFAGRETVKACAECNRGLFNHTPFDIIDRIDFLIEYLEKRHGLRRTVATWTTEELAELEPSLRDATLANIQAREHAFDRVMRVRILRSTIIESGED